MLSRLTNYFDIFRAADVERWRKQLEKTLAEVNSEIAVLHDAKESCERAAEAKALPHDITTGKNTFLLHYFSFFRALSPPPGILEQF